MNDLVNWGSLPEFNLDASLDTFADGISDPIAILSIRGSKWRINRGGDSTVVVDEDENPVSVFQGVILTAAPNVQRTYYEGKYDPDSSDPPDCTSNDGIRPDSGVENPQSKNCANCPMAEWGSAVSEVTGKGIPACRVSKKLAIVDPLAPDEEPLMLRVPRTAMNDFKSYVTQLRTMGKTPAMVTTTLGFDSDASYPKPTFKVKSAITQDEAQRYAQHILSGATARCLGLQPPATATATTESVPDDVPFVGEVAQPPKRKVAKKKATKKKVVSKSDEAPAELGDEDVAEIETADAPVIAGVSEDELAVLSSSGIDAGAFAGLETTE